jgi:hypothetical protein
VKIPPSPGALPTVGRSHPSLRTDRTQRRAFAWGFEGERKEVPDSYAQTGRDRQESCQT